ncbi:hypothetical protein ACFXG4_37565 [Nocardia sp. NPDC059246]
MKLDVVGTLSVEQPHAQLASSACPVKQTKCLFYSEFDGTL